LSIRPTQTRAGGVTLGIASCRKCECVSPILGGVPILVEQPAEYLAAHRDSVLASLAEVGLATKGAVEMVDMFAAMAPTAARASFDNDWVESERTGTAPPMPDFGSDAAASYRAFAEWGTIAGPTSIVEQLAGAIDDGVVVELGCGAGQLSRVLARRASQLVLGDYSLRAVLTARSGLRRAKAEVVGAVLDAGNLPLRAKSVRAIVAANLIDLVPDPLALVTGAARALKRTGRLVLTTPDPSLGGPDPYDDRLYKLVESVAGIGIVADRDGLPWIRPHSPRHHQVYFVRAIAALRS
jgi:SAM-dependent methyltransferase